APVQLEAYGPRSVLGMWEWYAGLQRLDKPVDFVYLPGAAHILVRPSDRMVSQGSTVDWFSFWLKGEEDPDPAKAEQYVRWRELRKLQVSQMGEGATPPQLKLPWGAHGAPPPTVVVCINRVCATSP